MTRSSQAGTSVGASVSKINASPEDALLLQESSHGHHTAKIAVRVLLECDTGFHEPSRMERDALLVGFAMRRRVLYGAAFNMSTPFSRPVDLADAEAIAANIDNSYEIKSTNRRAMKPNLEGYFFNITAAELLVAQSIGQQFRFAFVNTLSGEYEEMSLNDVFARSRAMYPAWHIRFSAPRIIVVGNGGCHARLLHQLGPSNEGWRKLQRRIGE